MKRAHTLEDVVEAGWAPSVHYLVVRLRRREIPGRKVGREWRMSDADVEAYLDYLSNKPFAARDEPRHIGLTAASMRRRAS